MCGKRLNRWNTIPMSRRCSATSRSRISYSRSPRSPKLAQTLRKTTRDEVLYLVLDGTLVPIDRVAADRPFHSGKHRRHGMNLQVIAAPNGTIVWVSGALPGSVHDMTAARIWGIPRTLATVGFLVLADKVYQGAKRTATHPLPRHRQTRVTEGRQPSPRPTSRTRRTRQRPAQALNHPPQAPLLPTPRRPPRQSHPRPTNPRSPNSVKKAHWSSPMTKPSPPPARTTGSR
ncbi:transposase family protein [Spirillospora sp. NPDC052269]